MNSLTQASTTLIQRPAQLAEIHDVLATQDGRRMFALLDACDEPLVQKLVADLQQRAVSLYRGSAMVEHWAIAPYIAQLHLDDLAFIERELTNATWGYFCIANENVELKQLRQHFRNYLTVQSEDAAELYFRFYDPRVLPPFLNASSQAEVDAYFGPVDSFVLPLAAKQFISLSR